MTKANRRQIAEAIVSLIEQGLPNDQIANAIAAYVVTQRCTRELDAIMREVSSLRATKGIREATIISARELDDKVQNQLEKIVANNYPNTQKVISNTVIDPDMVGGVRLETDDLRLDMTIRNRLQYLSQLTAKA